MNGDAYWLPIDQAPRDGTVIYGFFYTGAKPSELRADIRPIRWSGWGGGVWDCASSGHHIGDEPIMFTRTLPYPDRRDMIALLKKKHQKSILDMYRVTSPDELNPEQRKDYDYTPVLAY